MITKRFSINAGDPADMKWIEAAAQVLMEGGLVAFPTETVYGLGVNALDSAAARKVYAAKGRPSDNPLIVHIADMDGLAPLVSEIPEAGRKLAEAFWPGPLTLVFPKTAQVPYQTTGGLDTVAVRMPSNVIAHDLIKTAGLPVAAPSANTSGRPSPTTADHVWEDMNGKIDIVLDGGPVGIGLESTIVDVSGEVPVILRPGAVTREMVSEALGMDVKLDRAITGPVDPGMRPKAPGMKYRHYAPNGALTLVEGPVGQVVSTINRLAAGHLDEGHKVGVICTEETKDCYPRGIVMSIGARSEEETIAHNLYHVLRDFDDAGVEYIYSESFTDSGLGQAIMNRLTKAAGHHIIQAE